MPLNKDAYLLWKDNEVTKAFMREMKEGLQSFKDEELAGTTIEVLGMNALIRRAGMRTLEKVIKWKPDEAEDDSND